MAATLSPLLSLACAQASDAAKLKILCLHGYSQNGAALRDRSGGFRKAFKKSRFDLHFVDGPYVCADGVEEAASKRLAWWNGGSSQTAYEGWDEAQAALSTVWTEGQFDGVFGFSQGAAAAAMLCADLTPRPSFGVFVSGFVPRDRDAARRLLEGVQDVPTLHVFGEQDQLVTPERSRALTECFADACVVTHPGGHTIPSSAAVRAQVTEFVENKVLACEPRSIRGPSC